VPRGQADTCVNSLFGSGPSSEEGRTTEKQRNVEQEEELAKLRKELQALERNDEDNSFSLKLYGERLVVIENYHENWFKSLKEIERTRKELAEGKVEVDELHRAQLKLREDCL
jgi:hypothetical protein